MDTLEFTTPDAGKVDKAYSSKRAYFDSGATRSYAFRQKQLQMLDQAIRSHETEVLSALQKDLGKSAFEAYSSEIGILYAEIRHTLKHLKTWMQEKRKPTPLFMQPSSSKVIAQPKGVVLIIGPWNYPFQLLLAPLIGAIAAGNCAVLKPSNESYHTSKVVEEIIHFTFPHEYISVIQGPGRSTGPLLLKEHRYDHIFFTGSPGVGAQIMEMAAPHLSPVTLELGGKSPAIIDKKVNLRVAAKRATWAKFFNTGQTCVAPDHVWVHEEVKDEFIDEVKKSIRRFYGDDARKSKDYGRIINAKRMYVLSQLLEGQELIQGGSYSMEDRYFEPTLVNEPAIESDLMKEEIFGPIWPIKSWKEPNELLEQLRINRYPLACYIFSSDNNFTQFIVNEFEFGGGAINNAVIHLANPDLPFGGVGFSGMGSYHGKDSFATFSHQKSLLDSGTWADPSLRYPPYTSAKYKWLKRFL